MRSCEIHRVGIDTAAIGSESRIPSMMILKPRGRVGRVFAEDMVLVVEDLVLVGGGRLGVVGCGRLGVGVCMFPYLREKYFNLIAYLKVKYKYKILEI